MRLNQVKVGAVDLATSTAFYEALGFTLVVKNPQYARLEIPGDGITVSLHVVRSVSNTGAPILCLECEDLDADVARLKSRGISFDSEPIDLAFVAREALLKDPSGNALCLYPARADD